jgi:hypothetical protein
VPLKLKEPNPLNFYKIRKFKVPPQHLEYITVPLTYNLEETVSKWIQAHLKGRFYVGKTLGVDKEDKLNTVLRIGFEEHKELSYFTLACPLLKY